MEARPQQGDMVSAAGGWVVDTGHDGKWSELHEARILGAVTKLSDTVSYIRVSGLFADQSRQKDTLKLDVAVPKPKNLPGPLKLTCEALTQNPKPGCPAKPGVNIGSVGKADTATCTVTITRGSKTEALPFGCHPADYCQKHTFEEVKPTCYGVFYAGVIEATWSDPGDIWSCNCDCDDPSAAGAVIAAPVHGCAEAGLDPSSAKDRQTACSEVCAGQPQFCGAAPACEVGVCHVPASGATARLVGRSVCDPNATQQPVRVADAGDYHVTLDPSASQVTLNLSGHEIETGIRGDIHFNVSPGAPPVIDFADLVAAPIAFDIAGHEVTDSTLFTAQRLFGQMTDSTHFEIPAGVGVFAVRGRVDGKPRGINEVNPEAATGTIDLGASPPRFSLAVHAIDPEHDDRTLTAHLEGTIDDLPPVASAARTQTTVECTSPALTPVTLDGTASSDPDPGDAVAHYQWFTQLGQGLGNRAVVSAALPLAKPTGFNLHVYDRELGSDEADATVTVVDTTPPTLTVTPASRCLWPPNHKTVCFTLGKEIHAIATDTCDPSPTVTIVGVVSNQPEDGHGDGHTTGDASYDATPVCVRRERSAIAGAARTYTVLIQAKDHSGNATVRPVTITVPHDGCKTD